MNNSLLTLALVATTTLSTPTFAQDATVDLISNAESDGASERINFSGKLRMLSQRIPAAACHLSIDSDPQEAINVLSGASAEFDAILNALEQGDANLNINGVETNRKILAKLEELHTVWDPIQAAVESMLDGNVTEENLALLYDDNLKVLNVAKELVTEITSQYHNPTELVQADAFLIDIAGRQRMLLQKIAKESCMLTTNHEAEDTKGSLDSSINVFHASLDALRNGLPSAGIRRPPTSAISSELDYVNNHWNDLKPELDAILGGLQENGDAAFHTFHELNLLMAKMNEIVGMYTAATKNEA